jgi:hypothetical protein
MVIFESMLSHRIFRAQVADHGPEETDRLILGLGKAGAIVLMSYFGMKWIALAHGQHWNLLLTPYGAWWMVEVFGFVLLPCLLYAFAVRNGRPGLVRAAGVITVLGVVLNRLNISIVAYRWDAPNRYFPDWQEFMITVTIVTVGLLTFRWIVNRMPVLHDHAEFGGAH